MGRVETTKEPPPFDVEEETKSVQSCLFFRISGLCRYVEETDVRFYRNQLITVQPRNTCLDLPRHKTMLSFVIVLGTSIPDGPTCSHGVK